MVIYTQLYHSVMLAEFRYSRFPVRSFKLDCSFAVTLKLYIWIMVQHSETHVINCRILWLVLKVCVTSEHLLNH